MDIERSKEKNEILHFIDLLQQVQQEKKENFNNNDSSLEGKVIDYLFILKPDVSNFQSGLSIIIDCNFDSLTTYKSHSHPLFWYDSEEWSITIKNGDYSSSFFSAFPLLNILLENNKGDSELIEKIFFQVPFHRSDIRKDEKFHFGFSLSLWEKGRLGNFLTNFAESFKLRSRERITGFVINRKITRKKIDLKRTLVEDCKTTWNCKDFRFNPADLVLYEGYDGFFYSLTRDLFLSLLSKERVRFDSNKYSYYFPFIERKLRETKIFSPKTKESPRTSYNSRYLEEISLLEKEPMKLVKDFFVHYEMLTEYLLDIRDCENNEIKKPEFLEKFL